MSGGPSSSPVGAGRYTLHGKIAAGGMASVHFGRAVGAAGFSRIVAVKRMLPTFVQDPQFVAMFLDEARLASRIVHPNVVATIDVVAEDGEILIVMEYIRGQALSSLLTAAARAREQVPLPIATAVMAHVLSGLHAAHEARDRRGESLGIVHRDVSPHNILVGVDGIGRIMDFGIAKANKQLHLTQGGHIKGKISYMAPEQIAPSAERPIDRRADIYAAAVVMWSMLAGQRLFRGEDVAQTVDDILNGRIPPLSTHRRDVPPALEDAVLVALEVERERRYSTALEFQAALEEASSVAPARAVGEWVSRLAADVLRERDAHIAEIEVSEVSADSEPVSMPSAAVVAAPVELDRPTERHLATAVTPDPSTNRDLESPQDKTLTGDLSSSMHTPPAADATAPKRVLRWAIPVATASAAVTGAIVAYALRLASPPAPTNPAIESAAPPPATTPAPVAQEPTVAPAMATGTPEATTAPAATSEPAQAAAAASASAVPAIPKRPGGARPPPAATSKPCLPTDFNYPHCDRKR